MNKGKVATYILSFMLCLCLAMFAGGAGAYMGFLTDDSLYIAFSESKAFDDVREDVLEGIDYRNAPDGFDRLVAEQIITKDMVRGDVSSYIHDSLYGQDFEIDEEIFDDGYYYGLMGAFGDKNIVIGVEDEKIIDSYKGELQAYYQAAIKEVDLSDFVWAQNYSMLALAVTGVGGVGSAILFGVLWVMIKNKRDRIQAYGFAGMAGGILTMAFPTYMLASADYRNIQIGVEYLYNLTTVFIRNGFINVSFCGGLVLLLGIGCAVADLVFLND